jgi:hypothetical protein
MHDLRLVGVHEDGEHLLLSDAEGARFLLAVDEALRAAVRRDRPHLGQLQIEIEGGLRPRDVQSRIRAGATAEEVAALAGWTVEKVRRYEGPVLAEREHVADVAREVHLRRRNGSVTLGAEVSRRLTARGVDPDEVRWDAWRVEGDPWTVVVSFPAGGRERSARWHLDLSSRSVTPGDDEARWLSEDQPEGEGPLAGARLSAVTLSPADTPGRAGHVYDVEVDGGIGSSDAGSWSSGSGEALDLVSAMRARRQAGRGARRRGTSHGGGSGPVRDGDGLPTGTHPAGRRRPGAGAPQPEPLELDPSLMDDPPAAHPPAGIVPASTDHRPSPVTDLPSRSTHAPLDTAAPDADPSTVAPAAPRHWPLADAMRREPQPSSADAPDDSDAPPGHHDGGRDRDPGPEPLTRDVEKATGTSGSSDASARPGSARRSKRASVPSWDDIMFGAKQD